MSLSLFGGPADGVSIGCRRAPRLLRVVRSLSSVWDGLDLLDDEPRPCESIHLYECWHFFTGGFVCPGGYQEFADYRHVVSARPGGELDATLRDTSVWRRFVEAYFGITIDPATGTRMADVVPLRG